MQERVISFYEKVVSCKNTIDECPNTINCIEIDNPPRGFLSAGIPGSIDLMLVGKNPGHSLESEKGVYAGKTPLEIVKGIFETPKWIIPGSEGDKRSHTFHKNLIRYVCFFLDIDEEEVFKRCVYTNLVKCSTMGEQDRLRAKTMKECFWNHLQHEIDLWRPKVLLALGREVYYFLQKKQVREQHDRPVIYLKHPSYYYRKDQEKAKLEELKEDITRYLK